MIWLQIELFLFTLFLLSAPLELWLHYLAIMNLARVRDKEGAGLTKPALIFGSYLLIRGYFLDAFVQFTWMTIYFREWPQEWTVTGRIKRHSNGVDGWRKDKCLIIQRDLLKWFDAKHTDGIHR